MDFPEIYMSGVGAIYRRALSDKWIVKQSLYQRLKGRIMNNYQIKFTNRKTQFWGAIILKPKDWDIHSDIA